MKRLISKLFGFDKEIEKLKFHLEMRAKKIENLINDRDSEVREKVADNEVYVNDRLEKARELEKYFYDDKRTIKDQGVKIKELETIIRIAERVGNIVKEVKILKDEKERN